MDEHGSDTVLLDFPAVITVVKDINKPRLKTLKGMLESREKEVEVWNIENLECDETKIGLDGSPTRVVKTALPPPRDNSIIRIEGDTDSVSGKIMDFLKEKMVIENG